MFNRTESKGTDLTMVRNEALEALYGFDPTDPEYAKTLEHVKDLSNLIANERREKLDPNKVFLGLANVGIALVVVGYESRNVVTTKALSFLMKAF